jgi:hypothetical protein
VPAALPIIITVPCETCRTQTLKPLSELVMTDSVICRWCGTVIDLTRPYWREVFREAAEATTEVKPKSNG